MATVRTATEEDIPRILELYQQLSLNPSDNEVTDLSPEVYRKAFSQMSAVPDYQLLVVEEDGGIIGTTVLAILPGLTHNASPFAVIEYVVVDKDYRRRGIGKLLMDYCIARSREAGCYKIMLTSDNRRDGAHRFYQSLGFEDSAHGFRIYF